MKKIKILRMLLLFVFCSSTMLMAQEKNIWEKDFSTDIEKGYWGSNSDMNGITDWTLDISNCTLSDEKDYVKVVKTNKGRLEAVDCDGEAVWKSKSLDISKFKDCRISITVGETGSSTHENKYVKLYYQVDNNTAILFSENGKNSGDFGKVTAKTDSINGNELSIIVKLNNPNGSDKVYFDDIIVSGVPEGGITETDIVPINWQPENTKVASLKVTPEQAVELFRFALKNITEDTISTVLKQIKVVAGADNTVNWKKSIADFMVKRDTQLVATKVKINSKSAEITFDNNYRIVPQETVEFSVFGYLKKGKIIDGDSLQLKIDKEHEGWVVEESGSPLRTVFSAEQISPLWIFDVTATKMAFTKQPQSVKYQQEFGVEVSCTDIYDNIDIDSIRNITLSVGSGKGSLKSDLGLKKSTQNGMAVWDDLIYSNADYFKLQASSPNLPSVMSKRISAIDESSTITINTIENKLINATATTSEKAVPVFNFTVTDKGEHDALPTVISTLKFVKVGTADALNWQKHIAGATLNHEGKIIAETTTIYDNYIRFYNKNGILNIPDKSSKEFVLNLYLRKYQTPDNQTVKLQLSTKEADLKTITNSSKLQPITTDIASKVMKVNVETQKIAFIQTPVYLADNNIAFQVKIAATDSLDNIDTDNSSTFNIKLLKGKGTLSGTNNAFMLKKGVAEIKSLKYSGKDKFELVTVSDYASDSCSIFGNRAKIDFYDDFETNDLSEFFATDDWRISDYQPIAGKQSLKHNVTYQTGSSFIAKETKGINLASGVTQWQFIVKNDGWNPSSGNYFVFYPFTASPNPDEADEKYAVGINWNTSDDILSLWRADEKGKPERLIKSIFQWQKDETVAIKIVYSPKGMWQLYYNRLGKQENWQLAGEFLSPIKATIDTWYSALQYHFENPDNAGALWCDNWQIIHCNTQASIHTYKITAMDSIAIQFSEPIDIKATLQQDNFKIWLNRQAFNDFNIRKGKNNTQAVITTSNPLPSGNYKIVIHNITDLDGAVNPKDSIILDYFAPSMPGDVVINEVLFNPYPNGSDYVEIYNVSDKVIDVSKMCLGKRNDDLLLADTVRLAKKQLLLYPDSYMLFSADTANIKQNYFTADYAVFYLIQLPNYRDDKGRVVLCASNRIIDEFAYSEKMHFDLLTDTEGVALERINPKQPTNEAANWQSASQNAGFGTPGLKNSVYADTVAANTTVSIENQLFTPDFNGDKDRLYIHFNLPEDGYMVNIRIFNAKGIEVRKLASNYYLGLKNKIAWNGLNAQKQRLPAGIYIIYIELFNTDGEVEVFKKTGVIGGKFR